VVEGTPLLRVQRRNPFKSSNLFLSATFLLLKFKSIFSLFILPPPFRHGLLPLLPPRAEARVRFTLGRSRKGGGRIKRERTNFVFKEKESGGEKG
jgi:hypothetical protein